MCTCVCVCVCARARVVSMWFVSNRIRILPSRVESSWDQGRDGMDGMGWDEMMLLFSYSSSG